MKKKIIDCVTFFDNTFIFDLRFNILKNFVDLFVICESKFDHKNNRKKLNFDFEFLKKNKVKYIVMDKPFSSKYDIWSNQAEQREFLLKSLDKIVSDEDYIFFLIQMKYLIQKY
jgi:beta-1,4-mannosyl-glycoprotein beta-1,4-N-acetylglucosaminyltransferase